MTPPTSAPSASLPMELGMTSEMSLTMMTWMMRMRMTSPPEPRKAPAGFKIVEAPNFPHEALTPKTAEQQQLVGRSLLYYWAAVGWCVGVVTEANTDGRRKIKIEDKMVVCNFFVHYEIDDKTAQHCLLLEKYGGEDTDSWVLLEPIEEA